MKVVEYSDWNTKIQCSHCFSILDIMIEDIHFIGSDAYTICMVCGAHDKIDARLLPTPNSRRITDPDIIERILGAGTPNEGRWTKIKSLRRHRRSNRGVGHDGQPETADRTAATDKDTQGGEA